MYKWRARVAYEGFARSRPTLTGVRVCGSAHTHTCDWIHARSRMFDTHIHTREVISIRGADTA